jgi:hypothetical protein
LRELEEEINGLAGQRLLKWETLWSAVVVGYLCGTAPLPVPTVPKGTAPF